MLTITKYQQLLNGGGLSMVNSVTTNKGCKNWNYEIVGM